jgi:integrase
MGAKNQLTSLIGGASRGRVSAFLAASYAENTRRAYADAVKHFKRWGGRIPATPLQVARYAASYAGKMAYATLQQRLAGIHRAHLAKDLRSPVRSELVRATMKGIARSYPTKQRQMKPVLKKHLIAMMRHMKGIRGARDRALILLGFVGGFRRSELVALTVSDFRWARGGLIVTLRRSKTDQEGQGREVSIPGLKGTLCAVKAVRNWLRMAGIEDGAVFRPINRHGQVVAKTLSGEAVNLVVRRYAGLIGLDPDEYGGHSLRAGLVTAAALAGSAAWEIRRQTGHKSDAVLARYIREEGRFETHVAKRIFSE